MYAIACMIDILAYARDCLMLWRQHILHNLTNYCTYIPFTILNIFGNSGRILRISIVQVSDVHLHAQLHYVSTPKNMYGTRMQPFNFSRLLLAYKTRRYCYKQCFYGFYDLWL